MKVPNCEICMWSYKTMAMQEIENVSFVEKIPVIFCSAQAMNHAIAVYNSSACKKLYKDKISTA
jgi:hypothetical protein